MTLPQDDVRRRIHELSPWYQCIDLGDGLRTKDVGRERDIFADTDIPGPLWRHILTDLPHLTGKTVLDIGCNAGYMSFESKRLGASRVVGIDSNLGASVSFVEQAEFCRSVLGLDGEFREGSFLDVTEQFDVVLFCGVLYHLEEWSAGLDKLRDLVIPERGHIVLETAIERVTHAFPQNDAYGEDETTYFIPSLPVLMELLRERGFLVNAVRNLTTRVVLHLRTA